MTVNEQEQLAGKRLGRKKPSNKPALKLANVLTSIPVHPVSVDYEADWGLYTNDKYGVCGPTGVANSRKVTTKYLSTETSPSQDDVYDLYRRSGNPQFDPQTGADDNGVDLQTMLSAVQSGGIAGVKSVAFAKVDVSNLDEIRAAIDIFGFVLLGVDLELAQQSQSSLWDYKRSGEWGGHCVLANKYTSLATNDIGVVTWGEVVGTTDSFWQHQVEEAWVVIWPEHLGTKVFDNHVSVSTLAADYKALTGKTLPTPVIPTPDTPGNSEWQSLLDDIQKVFTDLENKIRQFFTK